MKTRPSLILFSIFLGASLLFTQVGLGYFHDRHDAHERIDGAHKDQTQLHKHGEHCKVCSIDLFFSLFIDDDVLTLSRPQQITPSCILHHALQSLKLTFFEGRGPPVQVI